MKNNAIILFNKCGIKITLNSLTYDTTMNGAIAEIAVSNTTDYNIEIDLDDIRKDDVLMHFDCWTLINKPIPPHTDIAHKLIKLSEQEEEYDCLGTFYKGYTKNYSFRIRVTKIEYPKNSDSFNERTFLGKGPKIQLNGLYMKDVIVFSENDFLITNGGSTVCATSDYCIPFETPKNADEHKKEQIRRFKSELKENIESLNYKVIRDIECYEHEVLVCGYSEKTDNFFDIENRCIYNLGTSTFTECCPTHIAFTRLNSDIFKYGFDIEKTKKYNYIYSLVPKKYLEEILSEKEIIAQWDNIPLDMTISHSPERYWKSIRKNTGLICINPNIEKSDNMFFGIKAELHVPRKVLPASVMKPLLDGIVCAFHKEENIEDIFDKIDISSFALTDDTMNLFGKRKYIFAYKDAVKWNPADERLMFAWISVIKEDCEPYITGKILTNL